MRTLKKTAVGNIRITENPNVPIQDSENHDITINLLLNLQNNRNIKYIFEYKIYITNYF